MVGFLTNCRVADNSGARLAACIKILGGSFHKRGTVGDKIVVAIKRSRVDRKVKKGEVRKGVIVRVNRLVNRNTGFSIRIHENAIVLIGEKDSVLGTRVFGPVLRELRERGWLRIITLAPKVL